mgnify:CR=1 FL=1|jgi:hypothetical protein
MFEVITLLILAENWCIFLRVGSVSFSSHLLGSGESTAGLYVYRADLPLIIGLTSRSGNNFGRASTAQHLPTLRTPHNIEQFDSSATHDLLQSLEKFVHIDRISTHLGCLDLQRSLLPLAILLMSWFMIKHTVRSQQHRCCHYNMVLALCSKQHSGNPFDLTRLERYR